MKRKILVEGIALLALAFCFACASSTEAQLGGPENKAPEQFTASNYVVSGPYSHKNLTIFLLRGADQRQDKTPLTLQEAMDRKMVVVHETGDVNNLAVENLSDEEVYVQSGDIVKGGRQDRVLALDLIVPPKSGKIQIASFCVEQGRWSGRGREEAGQFASSRKALNSKELKIAAKHSASQREVWDKVAQSQAKLSAGVVAADAAPAVAGSPPPPPRGQVAAGASVGTAPANAEVQRHDFSVASSLSSSSLQLSLENENLKQVVDDYVKKLSPIIEGKNDVIGYVFAINGQINSADVYSSSALFKKLWPKLIESSSTEAVGEFEKGKTYGQPQADAVKAFLVDSESGKADEKELTSRVTSVKRETEKNLFFETRDRNRSKTWVHRNYLAK
jgi:ARG and Rhodanese-Phosphatase-superfamily-associated Protein domain